MSKCNCKSHSTNEIVNSKGEVVILAVRNQNTVPFDLPYCIWGALYIDDPTSFGRVLQPYLPTGVTVTIARDSVGNLVFTYTDGIHTDKITVTVPTDYDISYGEIVTNTRTNYMKSNLLMFNCNAAVNATFLQPAQINKLLSLGLVMQDVNALTNVGGSRNSNIIIPRSRQMINNTVSNLMEIYLRKEKIQPSTVWVHKFGYLAIVGEPFPITFSFTVIVNEVIDVNCSPQEISDRMTCPTCRQNLENQVGCS